MRFTHRKGYDISISKVWSDDKEVCFGIVGPVRMLLHYGILDWCDYDGDTWCFIPAPGIMMRAHFGHNREDALYELKVRGF